MAIPIEHVSVIIVKEDLEKALKGGVDQFYDHVSKRNPTYLEDEFLCRTSFMATSYAIDLIKTLQTQLSSGQELHNLRSTVIDSSQRPDQIDSWLDVALIDDQTCVWLKGKDPGRLVSVPEALAIKNISVSSSAFRKKLERRGVDVRRLESVSQLRFERGSTSVTGTVIEEKDLINAILTFIPEGRIKDNYAIETLLQDIHSCLLDSNECS